MFKKHLVTHSFDNDEKNRCVDIIQVAEQNFRFQEWRREPEDISGWFLMLDSQPRFYSCAEDAIVEAKRAIDWFSEIAQSSTSIDHSTYTLTKKDSSK